MSHVTSPTGPVLGAHPRRWAVVGDVLNQNKPAFDVAARLEACGRNVARVSPYCKSGEVATSLEAVPGEIDAVNLIISPKLGVDVLEAAAARGIKYVFIQPGADGGEVLPRAAALGLTVQQGCVLVTPLPPLPQE
mmetsp:Transcript_49383/g.158960  ORF Transcript_49383/g.158960 Transcript_49383/m.158960 type:complete len:135 (-) Transcript_49383:69-473(-)